MLDNYLYEALGNTLAPCGGTFPASQIESSKLVYVKKKKFIDEIWHGTFGANNHQCAMALGVDPAQLLRFINSEVQAGPLLLGGLAIYCNERGLDFWDYIYCLPPKPCSVEETGSQ